jgi:ubiquilin
MSLSVTIKYQNRTYEIEIDFSETLKELKTRIESVSDISLDDQILTFNDRFLTDEKKSMRELNIQNRSIIYMKKRNRNEDISFDAPRRPDPNEVMLSNPMVKKFLKNPESMKGMLEMFPGIKEEMEKNPDLRMMMNNKQVLEEFGKMADNPEYMNQQLKNADIAMSKLENIPGGLNLMNSMLKDVRDPLSSALDLSFGGKKDISEGQRVENVILEPIPNPVVHKNEENSLIKYRGQLSELRKFGFKDVQKNIKALKLFSGDVEDALSYLKEVYKK